MVLELVGFTLETAGKILVAISVFLVHGHVMKERKIDRDVLKQMRKERNLSVIGILFIIIGYLLQTPFRMG